MSYKVVELVLDHGPADAIEALLLVAIAENASDTGYAWPGIPTLARRCRRTSRHVIRLLKRLEEDGWLAILRRAEGDRNKATAYQINLERLTSARSSGDTTMSPQPNGSSDFHIAPRKTSSCDTQIAHEEMPSCDTQMSSDRPTSCDISDPHHVTFEGSSCDISAVPILINHEPSLEPSGAVAPERVLDFGEQLTQERSAKTKSVVLELRKIAEREVEAIRLAYPRKQAPEPARKAIRAQHARLLMGDVITADGEKLPKMNSGEASAYLLERTKLYAASPVVRQRGDYNPYPATWFNTGSYTESERLWGMPVGRSSSKGIFLPPPMSTADKARMQRRQTA